MNLDKLTVSFVIAGTDDGSPHSVDEVLLLFRQLLSQFCETFEADLCFIPSPFMGEG